MNTTINSSLILLTILFFGACNEVPETTNTVTTETIEQTDSTPPPTMARQMPENNTDDPNSTNSTFQVVTGTLKEGSGIESECYISIQVEKEVLDFFYVYKTVETHKFDEITITGNNAPERLIIQDEDISLILAPQLVGKSVKVTYELLSSEAVREKFGFDLMQGSADGQERLVHTIEFL